MTSKTKERQPSAPREETPPWERPENDLPFEPEREQLPARRGEAGYPDRQYAGTITGDDLFPEDKWENVPMLGETIESLPEHERRREREQAKRDLEGTPFMVLDAFERPSEFKEGESFWIVVLDIGGSLWKCGFSRQPDEYDRILRIHQALDAGAKAVGPLTIKLIDTGKGNPFAKIVPYRPPAQQITLTTQS